MKNNNALVDIATLAKKPLKQLEIRLFEKDFTWTDYEGNYPYNGWNNSRPPRRVARIGIKYLNTTVDKMYTGGCPDNLKPYKDELWYPQHDRDVYNNVSKFFKDNYKIDIKKCSYDSEYYPVWISQLILNCVEKKLNKEINFTYPRDCEYEGEAKSKRWSLMDNDLSDFPYEYGILVYFPDLTDPAIIQDEFVKIFDEMTAAGLTKNISKVNYNSKVTRPRREQKPKDEDPKAKKEMAKSMLSSILGSTPREVTDYLKDKGLFEDFQKSFMDKTMSTSIGSMNIEAEVMMGDADGTETEDFWIPLAEWDYIKAWFNEYIKAFPMSDDKKYYFSVYQIYRDWGIGDWSFEAIEKLMESKNARMFSFDNGYSTVRITLSTDNIPFENDYELEEFDDPNDVDYDDVIDRLLIFASHWKRTGKLTKMKEDD